MIYLLAYAAGLLTLVNPCILPVLPIVLASALQGNKFGPLALALGMIAAFVAFGLGIAVIGQSFGLTSDELSRAGAWMMVAFGVVLLVPQFASRYVLATGGVASRANAGIDQVSQTTLAGQALTGALLGAVWSPCVGPALGGAISLSYQGRDLLHAGVIMFAFALGVGTLMLALSFGTRETLRRRQHSLRRIATWSRPVMGIVLVLVGAAILGGARNRLEGWALNTMPEWLQELSVAL